jgi:hypothetical protein
LQAIVKHAAAESYNDEDIIAERSQSFHNFIVSLEINSIDALDKDTRLTLAIV